MQASNLTDDVTEVPMGPSGYVEVDSRLYHRGWFDRRYALLRRASG